MHFCTFTSLWLTVILTITTKISAAPARDDVDGYGENSLNSIDRFDDDYYRTNRNRPVRRSYAKVDDLKRGLYYIDNGSITPVGSSDALTVREPRAERRRRQNYFDSPIDTDNLPDGVRFRPVIRYKRTHAKQKKLFVPNFFG